MRAVEVHWERISPVRDSRECERFELSAPSGGFATDVTMSSDGPAMCQAPRIVSPVRIRGRRTPVEGGRCLIQQSSQSRNG
jgi:hypothetical protein